MRPGANILPRPACAGRVGSIGRPRRVLMCGPSLNQANTGDRLLVAALAKILREDAGAEEIAYSSIDVDPRVARDIPGLTVINPRREPLRLLWRAFCADAFVVAGAVSFHDHRRIMLKQTILAWLCRLGGGRTVVNAASVQPIHGRLCRWLFRMTFKAANWFSVRDAKSVEHARTVGVRGSVRRSPDPGILCLRDQSRRIDEILAAEGVPGGRPILGIAPHFFVNNGRYRNPAYRQFQIEYCDFPDPVLDRYYATTARLADAMTEQGCVVFFPMCTRTPPGDDREAAEWIRRRMRHACRTHSLQAEYTVDELAGMVSRCSVLISTRLHGYALGLGNGVPSLAIDFHPKMQGLAQEVGLTDWLFPIQDLDAETISATVSSILGDLAAAQDRVRAAVSRAAARARRDFLEGVSGKRFPNAAQVRWETPRKASNRTAPPAQG